MILELLKAYADQIFLVGGMVLNLFALMALLDPETVFPRWQAFGYATVLFVFGATYIAVSFPLGALSFTIGGIIWSLISVVRGE
jgi:multisubunit Na+/H+ antiporter MnhG subunit